jgi:imidazolonepropionase-like amidohydrolase
MKFAGICFATAALILLAAPGAWGEEPPPLAVTRAVLIDGRGGPAVEGATILIRKGRIAAAGPGKKIEIPSGTRILDAAGKTVMPGLCDMHVHLTGGWNGWSLDFLGHKRYLRALLYAGVTTVLDTGNVQAFILQVRQEVRAGRVAGPRIFCVGPLIDGPDLIWPHISTSLVSKNQVPGLVERLADAGVDMLKVYLGPGLDLVRTLAREGKARGLGVLADQWELNGSMDLVRAGVAAFAHMPHRRMDPPVIAEMKQRGVRCLTTLTVFESFSRERLKDLSFLDDPLIRNTMPPAFIEGVRAEAARELTPQDRDNMRVYGKRREALANAAKLFEAGILLAAGTDTPFAGVFYGEGLHRELELLVEAGLTPLQVISLATRNAARFLDAGEEWGTLEKGRAADLLIVDGRPDRNISDTRKITAVIQGGRVLDREALSYNPDTDPGHLPWNYVSGGRD